MRASRGFCETADGGRRSGASPRAGASPTPTRLAASSSRVRRRVAPGELARQADDALAGVLEAGIVDGERDAQMADRARPEPVAGQDGDALAFEEPLGEFLRA